MSKIGTLAASSETTINLNFAPQFLVFGDITTGYLLADISAISWNIKGNEKVNLVGKNAISAFGKFKNNADISGGVIEEIVTVGNGYFANQQFQLRATNTLAGTIDVYGFSTNKKATKAIKASQTVVVDQASQRFENFVMLAFDPTNVTRVDLAWFNPRNGNSWQDSLSPIELQALFAFQNLNEAGLLSTYQVIDNSNVIDGMNQYITSAVLYVNGANVTVTQETLEAFV